jgi:endogenous inhibitor of DNA gyrase (YacG/DUF329 family)
MHENSYKIDIKKCDNAAINAVDSNTYPYCVYLCNKYILIIIIIWVPVFKQESLNIEYCEWCNEEMKISNQRQKVSNSSTTSKYYL